jgi:hypothetical protein
LPLKSPVIETTNPVSIGHVMPHELPSSTMMLVTLPISAGLRTRSVTSAKLSALVRETGGSNPCTL